MTADQLRNKFNEEFGLNPWPRSFEVDAETYANCCQFVFDNTKIEDLAMMTAKEDVLFRIIAIGPNKGLMFKNIELILKND